MKNGKLIDQVALVTGASKGIGAGIAKHPPLGRIGQPHDIAPVVAFLASPESAWITGEMITCFRAGFN